MLTFKSPKLFFVANLTQLIAFTRLPRFTLIVPPYLFLVSLFLLICLVPVSRLSPVTQQLCASVDQLHVNFFAAPHMTCASFSSFISVGNWSFISFLPEITLSIMIVYLIWALAIELAADRSPKALAIECWDAACCALSFVALLYAIQLFGSTPSKSFANGYLFASFGLTFSKLLISLTSLFVLSLSETYIREHTRHILEFSVVILVGVLLLLLLVSSNNLMLLFLTLAGFSLNLYILVLYDGADAASREASLKYFYLSTLSAGMILFGILLIYTTVGDAGYQAIRFYMENLVDNHARTVIAFGVLFILLGFFFKLSAFPGHLWAVEVYEGSPLPIMAFFVLPVKVAIFVTFLRLINTGLFDFNDVWAPCVTLSAMGSLIWGAFAGAQAKKTTRFLGYASINQIGFLLLGLVAITDDALRSAYFYLILYAIMTGGFLLVFTQLRTVHGAQVVFISDFAGLSKNENLLCWNLSVFLFSMAGIPPLVGFFGKYYLLVALTAKGLFVAVIVALAASLITAYYYLRVIKTMWFGKLTNTLVAVLTPKQRVLLAFFEAALWVGAVFAPWILPLLSEVVATLTVCADLSAQYPSENLLDLEPGSLVCSLTPLFVFTAAQAKARLTAVFTKINVAYSSFCSQLRSLPDPSTCLSVLLNNSVKITPFTEKNKEHFQTPALAVQNSKAFFYLAVFGYIFIHIPTSFGAFYLGKTLDPFSFFQVFNQFIFLWVAYCAACLLYLCKCVAYALGWWTNTPERKDEELSTFTKNWNADHGSSFILTTTCFTIAYYAHFVLCQSVEVSGYFVLSVYNLLFHLVAYYWLKRYYLKGCAAGKYVERWYHFLPRAFFFLAVLVLLFVLIVLFSHDPEYAASVLEGERCRSSQELIASPPPLDLPVEPPAMPKPKLPSSAPRNVAADMVEANRARYNKLVVKPIATTIAKVAGWLDFTSWLSGSTATPVPPAQVTPTVATVPQPTVPLWSYALCGVCAGGLLLFWYTYSGTSIPTPRPRK
jgi:NADH-quinone oxidoreductase subunit N